MFSRREIARDSGIVRRFDQKPLTGRQRVLTNNINDRSADVDALKGQYNYLENSAKHEETGWLSQLDDLIGDFGWVVGPMLPEVP